MSAENPVNKDILASELFVIRGHHLVNFTSLLCRRFLMKDLSNQEVADDIAKEIVMNILKKEAHEKIWVKNGFGNVELFDGRNYRQDVLGDSPDELAEYKRKLSGVMQRFLDTPDHTPVLLVNDGSDFICNICTHGKHCSKDQHDLKVVNSYLGDVQPNEVTTIGELKARLLEPVKEYFPID